MYIVNRRDKTLALFSDKLLNYRTLRRIMFNTDDNGGDNNFISLDNIMQTEIVAVVGLDVYIYIYSINLDLLRVISVNYTSYVSFSLQYMQKMLFHHYIHTWYLILVMM